MGIRRRITKPKEIPPAVKPQGSLFAIGHFNVFRCNATRRFYVFDVRVRGGKAPPRSFVPKGEGFDKIPTAVQAAKDMAERAYL